MAWVGIDGERAPENTLPLEDDGARHTVQVCMGTGAKETVKRLAGKEERS